MRRVVLMLLLSAFVALAGCDSGGEEPEELTESELLVASWAASYVAGGSNIGSATASGIDLLALLEANLGVRLGSTGAFTVSATAKDVDPISAAGDYVVDEDANTLTLTSEDLSQPTVLNYQFEVGNLAVVLTADGSIIADLGFNTGGVNLSGQQITLTLVKQ